MNNNTEIQLNVLYGREQFNLPDSRLDLVQYSNGIISFKQIRDNYFICNSCTWDYNNPVSKEEIEGMISFQSCKTAKMYNFTIIVSKQNIPMYETIKKYNIIPKERIKEILDNQVQEVIDSKQPIVPPSPEVKPTPVTPIIPKIKPVTAVTPIEENSSILEENLPQKNICKNCGYCGTEKFCPECGQLLRPEPKPVDVKNTCPKCGYIGIEKFCPECGTPLAIKSINNNQPINNYAPSNNQPPNNYVSPNNYQQATDFPPTNTSEEKSSFLTVPNIIIIIIAIVIAISIISFMKSLGDPSNSSSDNNSQAQTEEAIKNMTVGQENALNEAKTILSVIPYSHSGVIAFLEMEDYPTDDATFAADNCGADWNENAAENAESYLLLGSASRQELISLLELEGYTKEQAVYGVEANGY